MRTALAVLFAALGAVLLFVAVGALQDVFRSEQRPDQACKSGNLVHTVTTIRSAGVGMSETRSFDAPPGDDFAYLAAFQQLVLERSNDLITVTDPAGTIVYASPSWHTVLGWDPEGLLGTPRSSSSIPTITRAPARRCESRSTAARSRR